MIDVREDLFGARFRLDPYPTYARLLDADRPHWYPHPDGRNGMWLVAGHADVLELLKSQSITKRPPVLPPFEISPYAHTLLAMDAPAHGRVRSVAARAFTGERVAILEERIAALAHGLIDRARFAGGMDFMGDFAEQLPTIVIADMLGVPEEDHPRFRRWSNAVFAGMDAGTPQDAGHGDSARSLLRYLAELATERRARPRSDLISALVETCDEDGERLSEQELVALCFLLLVAGHETTVHLLGNGLHLLLRFPDEAERLRENPLLLPSAVEEILRFETPLQRATYRRTTAPLQIGETLIPEGAQVSAVLGAANRDSRVFPAPEVFDIERHPNRHVAFGSGAHFCLGPALARLEARITFQCLLERLPALRSIDDRPEWSQRNSAVRGLHSLRMTF